ncbi:MAG: glucose-6-phosphate dehydrogenase [Armatimonadota bacterium]|nr:MAG: glucose-6-phosphate dehydrogenase [Armatimonadota bacterium]
MRAADVRGERLPVSERATEVEPHLFVVMGGTGDLMRRKLLPALYHLSAKGPLRGRSHVLAVARGAQFDDVRYRSSAREALAEAGLHLAHPGSAWCDDCLHYHSIGKGEPGDYRALAARVEALEREQSLPGNRVFNLALPPAAFPQAITGLGEAGLNEGRGWTRIVVEKPFGRDLDTACELNELIHHYFDESQTYRIDHYLGKDTVQNLLSFRFSNAIFESLWNRDRVESVRITVAETAGAEGRGAFYDQVGAVRDMVQNHLTQLLCVTAMELPPALEANFVRDEKAKVLRSVSPIMPGEVVFGQYSDGDLDGERVPGYRSEEGVAADSRTETYAAARVNINNWRWQGVPFYLRTGKRLPSRVTEIVVNFRCPALTCFEPFTCEFECNSMVITLQPNEGFDLYFNVKAPGSPFRLEHQRLRFRYDEAFGELPDAYKTLLLDVVRGEQTFFVRADEVELAWRIYTPLLQQPPRLEFYPAGTWGPAAADDLVADGEWYEPARQG